MADPILLEVITTIETAVKEEILELYIPAFYGEAGILANHLPYISILKFGEVSYKDSEGKYHYLYIENGFLEVKDNKIVIISDLTIRREDLDPDEIEPALKDINDKVKSASDGSVTSEELEILLIDQKKLIAKSEILKRSNNK